MSGTLHAQDRAGLELGWWEAWRRACRYEVRHLTALKSTWTLLVAMGLLSIWVPLVAAFVVRSSKDVGFQDMAASVQWSPRLAQVPTLAFYLLVFATGPVSTELLRGATRTTWLVSAGRSYAFWAKCAVGATIGVAVAVISALLQCGGLAAVLAVKGIAQPAWGTLVGPVARLALWTVCWMVLCVAVASLIRNRVVPVLVLLLIPLLAERAIEALAATIPGVDLSQLGQWLPFAAGDRMLEHGSVQHAVVFLAFTLVVSAAGHAVYGRRTG
ncbi:hypothetical protein ACF1B0_35610 [Streptomyces anandii]|uniref:hypothetical protein n=1 Tax=Streptomyces anandii TaxID=285454 RepID=UPI0036FF3E11